MWNDNEAILAFRKKVMPDVLAFYRSEEEMISNDLTMSLSSMFLHEYSFHMSQAEMFLYSLVSSSFLWSREATSVGNLYTISPMFYEQTMALHSLEYPAINVILRDALKGSEEFFVSYSDSERAEQFTGRSVGDLFRERQDNPYEAATFLHGKSQELLYLLSVKGISMEQVKKFLTEFIQNNRFRRVEFDEMNREFIREFNVDWMDVLPEWYERRKIPVFYVKDFKVESITFSKDEDNIPSGADYNFVMHDVANMRYRVSVSVFNDSDVDGVVSFCANDVVFSGNNLRLQDRNNEHVITRNFLIEAGTGKQISVVMKGWNATFNTNISDNLPTVFLAQGMTGMSETPDTTECIKDLERSYFMPLPGEIIVDNEDEDFKLIVPSSRKRLRNLIFPFKEPKYEMGSMITLRDGVEVAPKHMINSAAYGLNKLTHAFMLSGSKASMEWTGRIEREGTYEIFAYIPPKVEANRMKEQEIGGMGSGHFTFSISSSTEVEPEEVNQYYIITYGEEKYEVSADVKELVGWVSLGCFELPVGESKVVLTDRGGEDQVLLGDAMRWVYVGDK